MAKVTWGLIGTGAIARAFTHGLSQTDTAELLAVGSRNRNTADAFGDEHGVPRRYGSYEELLADGDVQAVYISPPHPFHAEWTVKAAEAGKHVLCEKPMALNHAQAMAMVEAARENNVFLMEAFMYRCHPQTTKLVELIKEGVIGEIRMVKAAFGFGGGNTINSEGRLFKKELGGGGILDVGCYAVSLARLVAGAAQGKLFANPVEVIGAGRLGETGVDEWTAAVLRFDGDIIAQVSTAVRASLNNSLEVYGADGRITVPNPWLANRQSPDTGMIEVTTGGETQTIEIPADRTSFAYEAERVAEAIEAGNVEARWPAMTWLDTLGNLDTLDKWRAAIGLTYDAELNVSNTPVRGTLKQRQQHNMKYGNIGGLEKPVSKLIMGCDNQQTFAHGAAMWDDWFERGGNAFDTSWVYGGGRMEKLLGQWVKRRKVRDEVVVIIKGAHTPRCLPDLLEKDFLESLDRLQFDYADIYIMHRDNPDVPAGEFVDVLNGLKDRGLIRGAFGGSNWSFERFGEVDTYSSRVRKQGFSILNNNLSLARMVRPVWHGCVHVSDIISRKKLEKSSITNFSWSSQARGYFLPETERMKLGADNFTCWDSKQNRGRRARAEELALKKGCTPINIAAAYVLNQRFPSFALVGPRAIRETATILPALDIELSNDEIKWLWGSDE